MTSICPSNGRPIASVTTGNLQDYEDCVKEAQEAWKVKTQRKGDVIVLYSSSK